MGTAEVTNSSVYAQFSWSSGQTSPSIPVNASSTYSVTVTEPNGCTSTGSVDIVYYLTNEPSLSFLPTICEGQEELICGVTPSFGDYNWSTGATTDTIHITQAGSYYLTVTDANGCTTTALQTVEAAEMPTPAIPQLPAICNGDNQQITVSGGPFLSYNWSTGASTPTIQINQAGNYTVTVTNTNLCTATAAVSVAASNSPQANIVASPATCSNPALLSANGGGGYLWSNGATTSSISPTIDGIYTVTITNNGGCTATASSSVSIPVPPQVQVTGPSLLCVGDNAILNATSGLANYSWSNGATTSSINVGQSGNYTVTVTNAAGCTASASFPVFLAAQPTVNITGPSSLCNGSNLQLTIVGDFNACVWTTGATVASIPITLPGTYVVTVTNLAGCTATAQQIVTFGNSLSFDIVSTQAGCNSSASLSAGLGFTSYFWSNGATAPTITVTQPGPYSVTVSDASGCTGEAYESVSFATPQTVEINGPAAICMGGSAILTTSGGNFTSYLWSNGATTDNIPVTLSNTYSVTATDANGCTATASQPFSVLAPPTVDINGPASICTGNTASFALSGNFAQAIWNNGQTSPSISTMQPGTYTVTVTDANGCTAVASQNLTVSASLTPAITSNMQPCTLSGTLQAGTGYDNYLWSNGATTPSINVSQTGSYSVTVSDVSGCTGSASEAVFAPTLPQVSIQGSPSICAGGNTVFSVLGNFPQVVWSNGQTTASITITQPGIYTVTATDANGCTAAASQNLTVGSSLSPSIAADMQPCHPSGTLHAGAGYTNYSWSNGATTPSINVSQIGNYSVTVSDGSGCTGTASEVVTMPTLPQASIIGSLSICTGGSTVFSVSGNFPQVVWSTPNGAIGLTTPTITASQPGTYSVTATDANGCTAFASQNLSIGSSLSPAIAPAIQACLSTATLNAGTGYASYLWSNGATSPSISIAQAGNYSLTVSDASGCTGTATESISFPALPQVQVAGPIAICPGENATFSISGNFPQVVWSNGQTSQSINATQSGSYSVTVTDANGCTTTDAMSLTLNPAPTPDITAFNIGCDGNGTLTTGTNFISYLWSNPTGASVGTTPSINVAQAGTYSVIVTNASGCTGQAQFDLSFPTPPLAGINGPGQICEGYSEVLSVPGSYASYLWNTGAISPTITITEGGQYSVTVTGSNGCTDEAQWAVVELPTQYVYFENHACSLADTGTVVTTLTSQTGCDSVVTLATLLTPTLVGSLSLSACPGESAVFGGVEILSGTTQDFVFTSTTGCDSILSVSVAELPAVHLDWQATPSCWNGSDGSVVLTATAGIPPYQYALDGGDTKESPSFTGLSAGSYTMVVQDGNGCEMEMPVQVPATERTVIVLEDAKLHCGEDAAILEPKVMSGDEQAIAWRWSNGLTEKNMGAANPGVYILTADDGCEVQDLKATVMPDADWDRGYFYVPNSFSPDGNAINDHFMAKVAVDADVRKFEFMVFDRWGNSLYVTYDPTSIGWDGLHLEEKMNTAVFAWYLKAIVGDCRGEDKEVFMEGGVTMMR